MAQEKEVSNWLTFYPISEHDLHLHNLHKQKFWRGINKLNFDVCMWSKSGHATWYQLVLSQ